MIGKTKKHKGKSDCCNTSTPAQNNEEMPHIEFYVMVSAAMTLEVYVKKLDYDYYEVFTRVGEPLAIIAKEDFVLYQPPVADSLFGWFFWRPNDGFPSPLHTYYNPVQPFYIRGVMKNGKASHLTSTTYNLIT